MKNRYFKLDLCGAYNMICIKERETNRRRPSALHDEYLVMPFHFCNSPIIFQQFVINIFKDSLYQYILANLHLPAFLTVLLWL